MLPRHRLHANLEVADKNLDKLESWRLPWFGGKSKTRGARAAKGAQAQAEAPGGVPADAVDPRRRSTSSSSRPTSYANVASGLEGRDAEETAALARVAAKDDDVLSSVGNATAGLVEGAVRSVTGDGSYKFGDITKRAVAGLTGKDGTFGDLNDDGVVDEKDAALALQMVGDRAKSAVTLSR